MILMKILDEKKLFPRFIEKYFRALRVNVVETAILVACALRCGHVESIENTLYLEGVGCTELVKECRGGLMFSFLWHVGIRAMR